MPTLPKKYGRYRVTPETVRRPIRAVFEPKYAVLPGVLANLSKVERADQELRHHELNDVEARRVLEDALTRNAFGTASIEGNPLTLEDVQSLLAKGPTPESLARPDEREILNHVAFMRTLPGRPIPRKVADVQGLHAELFQGVLPDGGELKRHVNFIGTRPSYTITFIPAGPERVKPELQNAIRWLLESPEHPLIKIPIFFHEFESIHPFRDGNGRAGRALTTLLLLRSGYPGVRYALVDYEFNQDRDAYYSALSEVERGDFDYTQWLLYMSGILARTFEGAVDRFQFEGRLPARLNERRRILARWFRKLNREAPSRRVKLHDVLAANPTTSERTLKRDLAALRDAGVLEVEGELKGTRYRLSPRPHGSSTRE